MSPVNPADAPHKAPDAPVRMRNAASVIVLRKQDGVMRFLMGQRGATAAFMPDKFVFPGGALDADDGQIGSGATLQSLCRQRLRVWPRIAPPQQVDLSEALPFCALRELNEETGLSAHPAAPMTLLGRAITPPGRTRRFDARFFVMSADHISGDMEGFSGAEDELINLRWVDLDGARGLDLAFITRVMLGELGRMIRRIETRASAAQIQAPSAALFFDPDAGVGAFRQLL